MRVSQRRCGRGEHPLRAILVHGMGRTAVSQMWLAARLRRRGVKVSLFSYSATFNTFDATVKRLAEFIEKRSVKDTCVLVGHSLGCVLIRSALAELRGAAPSACFFLAPPSKASRAAKAFRSSAIYRAFNGEMGQFLGDPSFMDSLPIPTIPTRVYAGNKGPRGRHSPFGLEPNDGILAVSETPLYEGQSIIEVPMIHTFIMNSRSVLEDILEAARTGDIRRPDQDVGSHDGGRSAASTGGNKAAKKRPC